MKLIIDNYLEGQTEMLTSLSKWKNETWERGSAVWKGLYIGTGKDYYGGASENIISVCNPATEVRLMNAYWLHVPAA